MYIPIAEIGYIQRLLMGIYQRIVAHMGVKIVINESAH